MKSLQARNPLSIIALFISLIYGISALLLGASVEKLAPDSQERLVYFIILFPVGILMSFLYLVTWHHRKLYSPSDFRTDESFLTSSDPEEIGRKYIKEGQPEPDNAQRITVETATARREPEEIVLEAGRETNEDTNSNKSNLAATAPVRSDSASNLTNFAAFAYMIEGLVMQELQNEFKSPIRRDAAFPMANGRLVKVDGLIEGPETTLVAEIKLIRQNTLVALRIREGLNQLRSHINAARDTLNPKTSGILVLVLDKSFTSNEIRRIRSNAQGLAGDDISVRVLSSDHLIEKYGLSSPSL